MADIAKTGHSRVFVTEGGARPDHEPAYEPCWRVGGIDHGLGDVERIECPDPDSYSKWIEVAQIQTTESRPTTDIQGRYPVNEESKMARLARRRCIIDIQNHLGRCTDPRNFNDCEKAVIFEDVLITNYSTSELGALTTDANAVIDETGAISASRWYEALPIKFASKGDDVVTNPVIDVVICDSASCGDCEDESDGCQKVFAVDDGATGSPGTAPDVLYSSDKGATWAADDVNSLASGEAATGIACVDEYAVVISNASNSLHYKAKSDILDGVALGWAEVTTGFVVTGEPNDIWSTGTYAFIVGDGGYVYGTSDPTTGVTVLDAGVATTDNLNAVHALNENFAVAVGATDAIIYTRNGTSWQVATATGGGNNLLAVWVVNENLWWVGDDGGSLYYTLDGGNTWTEVTLPGTGWTDVNDIAFATKSVGRIAVDKSGTPKGFVLETWDGGASWTALPRGTGTGTYPANDVMKALAVCSNDVNLCVAVGTADNGTDGVIMVGTD